jgi:hypothetical protein
MHENTKKRSDFFDAGDEILFGKGSLHAKEEIKQPCHLFQNYYF